MTWSLYHYKITLIIPHYSLYFENYLLAINIAAQALLQLVLHGISLFIILRLKCSALMPNAITINFILSNLTIFTFQLVALKIVNFWKLMIYFNIIQGKMSL